MKTWRRSIKSSAMSKSGTHKVCEWENARVAQYYIRLVFAIIEESNLLRTVEGNK
jgi:hypothetical protein